MEKMKHFSIIEQASDSECPMIGTIDNITDTAQGINSLKERCMKALEEHFDSDDIHFLEEFPDVFSGSPYEDFKISIDEGKHTIRILETWIY